MSLITSKPNLVCTSIEMLMNVQMNVEIIDRCEYFLVGEYIYTVPSQKYLNKRYFNVDTLFF